jgi:DNA-binding transcriptional LysR family regulator
MIEIRHLRYFVVLAEERHFSRAADRLYIAQPGLSQQIQSLEAQLGVSLIDRTKRRVELTAAGQALLEEGRRALAEFDRVVEYTRRVGRGEVGRLRIGVIASAIYNVLPGALRAFRARYPNVELIVREMTTPVQVNAMNAGEIDVGLMRLPYATGDLETRPILEERLGVVLPERHPLAVMEEMPLTALADQPMIIFPAAPRPSWADFVLRVCRQAGFEPRVVQAAMEAATVMTFVAADLGLALIPESLQALVRPGIVYRPISPPTPLLPLAIMYRSGPRAPTTDAFISIIDEFWPEGLEGGALPAWDKLAR